MPHPDAEEATVTASSSNFPRPTPEPITLPEGALVRDMLDLLGDRARAGDAQAACELAHAIDRCRMHVMFGQMRIQPLLRELKPDQVDELVEFEARRLEAAERQDQFCDGLTQVELDEGVHFSARAALSGHVDSLVAFLSAPDDNPAPFIRDPALAALYRERLWPVLLRALKERNVAVADRFFATLGNGMLSVSGAVPPRFNDREAARAMHRILRSNQDREAPQIVSSAPPSAEAQATADAWAQELFDGEPPMIPASTRVPPDPLTKPKSTCSRNDAWLGADQR